MCNDFFKFFFDFLKKKIPEITSLAVDFSSTTIDPKISVWPIYQIQPDRYNIGVPIFDFLTDIII